GATGVPVEGDPGWGKAAVGAVASGGIDYQWNYYGRSVGQTPRCGSSAPGRKCVRFYADSVHHFALSLNPEYRYEQGRYKDVVVHVLYLPGDSATWGHGIAVHRTEMELARRDWLWRKCGWPQRTNAPRTERGGDA